MSTPSPARLEVRDLGKAYRGRAVIAGVQLRVQPGEAVAVIGPNGAGKSTLLGCITGDRRPDSGEIRVCGADPFRDLAASARCTGVVPEQPFLYGELTVDELLRFVAEARGIAPETALPEKDRLLTLLEMSGAGGALCRELSQGMARKTAIVAALLHRPPLLVLDEALNGLDRTSAARLLAELDERRSRGDSVLISSHDLEMLAAWCGRGLLLAPGPRALELRGEAWERWRAAPSLNL